MSEISIRISMKLRIIGLDFIMYFVLFLLVTLLLQHTPGNLTTSSPKGNDRSPESNMPTSSHFKQASK